MQLNETNASCVSAADDGDDDDRRNTAESAAVDVQSMTLRIPACSSLPHDLVRTTQGPPRQLYLLGVGLQLRCSAGRGQLVMPTLKRCGVGRSKPATITDSNSDRLNLHKLHRNCRNCLSQREMNNYIIAPRNGRTPND